MTRRTERIMRYAAIASPIATVATLAHADVIASGASTAPRDCSQPQEASAFRLFDYTTTSGKDFHFAAGGFFQNYSATISAVAGFDFFGNVPGVHHQMNLEKWYGTVDSVVTSSTYLGVSSLPFHTGTDLEYKFVYSLPNDRTITVDADYDLVFTFDSDAATLAQMSGYTFIINSWSYIVEESTSTAVPGLSSIAILALGAAGIRRGRNRFDE